MSEREREIFRPLQIEDLKRWAKQKKLSIPITSEDDELIWAFIEWMLDSADGDRVLKRLTTAPRQLWLDFGEDEDDRI